MRASSNWCAPHRRASPRCSGWPTATPSGSLPSPCGLRRRPISLSGDPTRVLAVLVVATPCPLILATPVAIVGGINRAARHGIIFRHGTALEQLARVRVAVFDKTGTLTIGRPQSRAGPRPRRFTPEGVLRLAGAWSTAPAICSRAR